MSDAPLLRPERRQELRALTQRVTDAAAEYSALESLIEPTRQYAERLRLADAEVLKACMAFDSTITVNDVAALLDENEKLAALEKAWTQLLTHDDDGLLAAVQLFRLAFQASQTSAALGRVPLSGEAPE